jgi:hypothetical protein
MLAIPPMKGCGIQWLWDISCFLDPRFRGDDKIKSIPL